MSFLPERSWWGPTHRGGSLWTAQPVAHAIGGALWCLLALLLWWPQGGWRPVLFTAAMTLYWQLRIWEPEPDGTYPFRWVMFDVVTAILAAAVLLMLRAAL